ncbi:unnamed protein product, partial [Heterosigma akashiwo]
IDYPYAVDFCDHFETPFIAYQHLVPVLNYFAQSLNKSPKKLRIYDPYYCAGSAVSHLNKLGFKHVINNLRDFYADIREQNIPEYDILVSNPPYSDDHKEKCLEFCRNSGKPWCLLLPNYIANKQYYKTIITGTGGPQGVFYLSPSLKYEYQHPEEKGHDTSPFFSFWYVCFPRKQLVSKFLANPGVQLQVRNNSCTVSRTIDDLRSQNLVPTQKRMNNKRRKKLKAKKMQMEGWSATGL